MEYQMVFYKALQDDEEFMRALQIMLSKGAFATDLLITLGRRLNFAYDEKLTNIIKNHPEGDVSHLIWRLHTACWAAHSCLELDGAFVEWGVQDGTFAYTILEYLSLKNKKDFYLYDTFSGIPDRYNTLQEIDLNHDQFKDHGQYEKLKNRFSEFNNVHLVKGVLPDKLSDKCPEKISFLHMDLNNHESERDTLRVLIDKLTPGGIVLFQSYEFDIYKIWKISDDDFIKENNIKILSLPTGQGMFVKR